MKINVENTKEIKTMLETVQKRARTRTINITNIDSAIKNIEKQLETTIPKNDWQGIVVLCDCYPQMFDTAYVSLSTQFILERGVKNWFIVDCARCKCTNGIFLKQFQIYFTDEQVKKYNLKDCSRILKSKKGE